jgi:hypothetical protein
MSGFFLFKIINYGVIQFLGSQSLSVRYGAFMQAFEFIFLSAILFIFRSRPLP